MTTMTTYGKMVCLNHVVGPQHLKKWNEIKLNRNIRVHYSEFKKNVLKYLF